MRADSGWLPFTRSSREYDLGKPRDFIVDKSRGFLMISPRENLVKLIGKYPDIPVVFPRFGLLGIYRRNSELKYFCSVIIFELSDIFFYIRWPLLR